MSDLEKPNDSSRQPPPGVGSPQQYQQPYAHQQPYMQQQQPQPYMQQPQPYQQPYMQQQQQQPQYVQQQQQPQYMQQQQPQYMQQQPQYMQQQPQYVQQQQQPQYMQQQQPQYMQQQPQYMQQQPQYMQQQPQYVQQQQQQVTYVNPVQPLQLVGTTILTTTVPGFLPPLLPPQPPNLWTSDFCDCCAECGNCVETAICPYCQLGYLDRKLSSGYSGLDWGTCLMYWCIDTWFTCGLALAWGSCQTRDRVRLRFNIEPQDTCKNCAQGFFCPHISLCQSYRELSHRGYWPEGMCVNVPPPVTHPMGNPMPVQVVNAVTMP